jgi:hypothetical protein
MEKGTKLAEGKWPNFRAYQQQTSPSLSSTQYFIFQSTMPLNNYEFN